ncbi:MULTISPECIES: M50 family metallopeptidase [Bacillaceae]|uniref:M50 family metallopeptidase n=1 Tax=Bacillaceae TaxID=186817 RepID=UPI000C768AFA|nr:MULTISPECIES: M50 family metallopeptidase [Bacillaceae]PLR68281.1 stage IV sporulation protein FB [Bacillus sp. UMB0893]QNG61073.1 M50 family metallopeptidase [Bacillus sp. PAMC26568]
MTKYLSVFLHIHFHPILWLIMGISVMTAHFKSLLILLFIVFVHELGHAMTAKHFNWRLKSIVLLPFGGVAEVDEHGNRPLKEELLTILAGPFQHIWLQGAAFLLQFFGLLSYETYQLFTFYNGMILLFNLLPIWPLDGGKLLFLFVSMTRPYQDAHRAMLMVSALCLALYLLVFLILFPQQLNVWVIAGFLIYSLYMEHKHRSYVSMRFLLERYYGNQQDPATLMPIVVDEGEPIFQTLLKFRRGCKHPIIVERNGKKLFELDENELLHAFFADKRTQSTVGELNYDY